jgi:hypothetical protein
MNILDIGGVNSRKTWKVMRKASSHTTTAIQYEVFQVTKPCSV